MGNVRETLKARLLRLRFNLHPVIFATGARMTYLTEDLREVRLELPLTWRTRNYVGTIFGGSMFAALDPIPSVMLIRNLGPGYVVWDKAATIRFLKAGRTTLYAGFVLDDGELESVRSALAGARSVDRGYRMALVDAAGVVHATIEKTVYVRNKNFVETTQTREVVA